MCKSHHIINSNGYPSYFLLTSAHGLFIAQAPLTSVNIHSLSLSPSLFVKPQWPSGCSRRPQTHSYLSTWVLTVLSTWHALLPHCPGSLPYFIHVSAQIPPLLRSLSHHPICNASPALPCLHPSIFYFFLSLVETRPPKFLVASPTKNWERDHPSIFYLLYFSS